MDYPYAETGNRIFELRKERSLSREKLAEMADISVQFLADIEKGRKNMTITTLRKLASALIVSTDYIVNGTTGSADTTSELFSLCSAVPAEKHSDAAKLLRLFLETTEK